MQDQDLFALFPQEARPLLTTNMRHVIKTLGKEALKEVVLNVMLGKNLRDATEPLTRKRLATLNLAVMEFFLEGAATTDAFLDQLPASAANSLKARKDIFLAEWALGLTHKAFANVLRNNPAAIDEYAKMYDDLLRGFAS